MDRNEALQRLRELQKSGDPEGAHSQADDVLCDLLRAVGYGDVVVAWEAVDRWYA